MPHPSKAIANWFLSRGVPLTPMKLQKLVYFAHGWHLAIKEQRLIDEAIEAWRWGPVVPSLYHEFKRFGSGNIQTLATSGWRLEGTEPAWNVPEVPEEDVPTLGLLKEVWDVYGHYSGVQLSAMTHLPDSPWTKVWNDRGQFVKGTDIPDDLIKAYFKHLAAREAHA